MELVSTYYMRQMVFDRYLGNIDINMHYIQVREILQASRLYFFQLHSRRHIGFTNILVVENKTDAMEFMHMITCCYGMQTIFQEVK